MEKLAIVSSYDEECGAAFYSSRLKHHLEQGGYQVDVKRLPVSLLRINEPYSIRLKGDAEIARIAKEIADYDAVLLQFEPGLYGSSAKASYRRVRQLLRASKKVIITIHGFDRGINFSAVRQLLRGQIREAIYTIFRASRIKETTKFWRYVEKASHVQILTFCRADQTLLERLYNIRRIDNFPIAYYDREEVQAIRDSIDRDTFLRRYGLDPSKKHFAVCGFLAAYKGHLTAMKALEYLPEDWNLVVLGGEHPHAIEADLDIGGYLNQLLNFLHMPESSAAGEADLVTEGIAGKVMTSSYLEKQEIKQKVFKKTEFKYYFPNNPIRERVKFVGQVSDEEMAKFYTVLDYFVHPYMKTKSGQSGSGPATLALEFGTRALFSNAPVFREMERYFSQGMAFFNVGNFVELADALTRYPQQEQDFTAHRETALETYNPANMVATYRRMIGSKSV